MANKRSIRYDNFQELLEKRENSMGGKMKLIAEEIEKYCLEKSTLPSSHCKRLEDYTH